MLKEVRPSIEGSELKLQCIKCKAVLPEGSIFCCYCGKKQTAGTQKRRAHKRAMGTGTITKNPKCRHNPYIVRAPATSHGTGRIYLGSYPDMVSAQKALEDYIANGRPELYNATLADIYKLWSGTHFESVSESAVKLYSSMWKRFRSIENMKMTELRTVHFQELVNAATSRSSAEIVKALATMLCRYAMENDIVSKNYATFVKLPKVEKKEKAIFTDAQIAQLWQHSDDKRIQAILAMIYMGFRIGELLMIRPMDINFEQGYIIAGEKTEAGKNRVIPFPPEIPEIESFFKQWCEGAASDQRLFGLSVNSFRSSVFYPALYEHSILKYGDKQITPHSTRHTFASLAAKSGMRPEELRKIIGHANYAVTADVYIHNDVDTLKTAMTSLKKVV